MAKQQDKEPAPRREGSYPYYNLTRSLTLAEAVKEYGGGRSEVRKDDIAQHLDMGESSSSLSQLLSSAKCFGMIKGSRAYSLTDEAQKYFFPTKDSDRRDAELTFLAQPAAFRLLLQRFDGNRLPPPAIVTNILIRDCGIPESWASRVTGIFLSSVQDLGVIDAAGQLRFQNAQTLVAIQGAVSGTPAGALGFVGVHGVGDYRIDEEGEKATSSPQPARVAETVAKSAVIVAPHHGSNAWIYSEGGRTVRLETPDLMSPALWERLRRYVEVLKPDETEGGGV